MRKKKKPSIRYSTSSSLVMYIDDSDNDDSSSGDDSVRSTSSVGEAGPTGKAACFSSTTPQVCGLMVPSASPPGEGLIQGNEVYLRQQKKEDEKGGRGEGSQRHSTDKGALPSASPPLKPFAQRPSEGDSSSSNNNGDAAGREGDRAANSRLFRRRSVESIYFPPPAKPAPRPPLSSPLHPGQEANPITLSEGSGATQQQACEENAAQHQHQRRQRRLTIHLSTFVHMETPKNPADLGWYGTDNDPVAAAAAAVNGEGEGESKGSAVSGNGTNNSSEGKGEGGGCGEKELPLRVAGWRGANTIRISPTLHTAVDLSRASILTDPAELYTLRRSFDPPTPEEAAAATAELLRQRPLYPPPVPTQQAPAKGGNTKRRDKLKAHTRHGRKQQGLLQVPLTPPPPPPPQGFPEEETRVLLELPLAECGYHCVTVPRHGFRTVTHFRGWLVKQAAAATTGQGPLSAEVSVYNYAKKAYDPLRSPACVMPYAVFRFGSGSRATPQEGGSPCDTLDEKYATVSSKTLAFRFAGCDSNGSSSGNSNNSSNRVNNSGSNSSISTSAAASAVGGQKRTGSAWDSATRAVADAVAFTNTTRDCIMHVSIEEVAGAAGVGPGRKGGRMYELDFFPQAFFLRPGEVVDVQATLAARCTLSLELTAVAKFCIVAADSPEKSDVRYQTVTLTAAVKTPHTARLCLSELVFEGSEANDSKEDTKEAPGEAPATAEAAFLRSARATWRGNAVAVKAIPRPSEKVGALLQAEAQTLFAAEACPHFARFYGAVYTPGADAYLVTEFCETGTLRDALAGKPFPLLLKLKCLLDCAAGMRYLHSLSIMHKRLKPSNVLFYTRNPTAAVNCKVTDVGSLWDVSGSGSLQQSPPLVPTAAHPPRKQKLRQRQQQKQHQQPHPLVSVRQSEPEIPVYTAPEIIVGKPYGTPADVYSFAYIIWFVYFGYEAYTQGNFRTSQAVADYVSSGKRLPIPLDTPPAIADMIAQCWDMNQSKRPTFAQVEETLRHAYSTIAKRFWLAPP